MTCLTANFNVYSITNRITDVRYIGSSRNVAKRWSNHRRVLRLNKHHSLKLQNAWNKYGEANFIFEIIEIATENSLLSREQFWLDYYPINYNILSIAGSPLGRKHTEETKQKISQKRRGIPNTIEQRKLLSEIGRGRTNKARTGMPHTDETKAKMSLKAQGNKSNLGRKFSEEHIRKMVASRLSTLNQRKVKTL